MGDNIFLFHWPEENLIHIVEIPGFVPTGGNSAIGGAGYTFCGITVRSGMITDFDIDEVTCEDCLDSYHNRNNALFESIDTFLKEGSREKELVPA